MFSVHRPSRLVDLSLVVIVSCSSALVSLGPRVNSATVASARGADSPVGIAQPCEWHVTVPLRPLSVISPASLVPVARRSATPSHPLLAVSPRSVAIGKTIAVAGSHFNRSLGPITLRAEIPESDMLFEVHGTTRPRVDAKGTLTARLYLPYGIPTGRATLYAEQRGQIVAQTGFHVTKAVTSPPPLNPFSISRMQTFGPAGHPVSVMNPHEPITVRTWWKTGYVGYTTQFQFRVRVSVFHGQWYSFGLVGQGTVLATYQKQFCFVLIPPTGTYSRLRVQLTLLLPEGVFSSAAWTQSRTVTIEVRRH